MNKPIFLLGAHKSGSSLLRSLLDGHPELFVVPFEAHFFQMANYWVDYRLRKARPPELDFHDLQRAYQEMIETKNSYFDPSADSNMVGKIDIAEFQSRLGESVGTFVEMISNYVKAIYGSLYHQDLAENTRVVEKSVENAEFAADLRRLFPDSQFIHIIRNPYSNLVAMRRHFGRSGYPYLGWLLLALYNSYYNLYRNQRILSDYWVVRYEDLITQPEEVMRSMISFLNLEFHECLTQPTIMGELWKGNSSRGFQYFGVSADNLNLWKDEIKDIEIFYINRFFSFILQDYGYKKLEPRKWRYWPTKGENLINYFRNRTLQYYF